MERNVVMVCRPEDKEFRFLKNMGDPFHDVELMSVEDVKNRIPTAEVPQIGQVLIKGGNVNKYFLNDNRLGLNIMLEQAQEFIGFCSKLGATKVRYIYNNSEDSHKSFLGHFKFKNLFYRSKGSLSVDENKELKEKFETNDENYVTHGPALLTQEEWEEAKNVYEGSDYLKYTKACGDLLEMRKPNSRLQKHIKDIKLELGYDINLQVKAAAKLKSVAKQFEIDGDFTYSQRKSRKITIDIHVEFAIEKVTP